MKAEQNLSGVLERYAWLYEPGTVYRMQEAYHSENHYYTKERLRRTYYYLLDGYLERRTAAMEDAIASSEMNSTVEVDGERIAYFDVLALMANEPDFESRNRLQDAFLSVVEQTNPDRLAITRTRLKILAQEFGYDDYTAYNIKKKSVNYGLLRSSLQRFLSQTEANYTVLMNAWIEETISRHPGEIGVHHFSHVGRMTQYDKLFAREKMLEAYVQTLSGMDLEAMSQNIHLDAEERPMKNPRPCCYVPDPPNEIHLIIKPMGGLEDYTVFFHEAGHAQHYGNVDPALDYIFRAVPTSYALTEVYAFLLQNLTQNERWLHDVVGLPRDTAREVVHRTRLTALLFLRRYAALFDYELDFFEDPLNEARNRELYAAKLSAATRFLYPPQRYLWDMDSDYYSADYLRAWITEAMLRRYLEDTFGEGWFARSEAGVFLLELWSSGESVENEDIARMLGYEPFDTTCLTELYGALGPLDPL